MRIDLILTNKISFVKPLFVFLFSISIFQLIAGQDRGESSEFTSNPFLYDQWVDSVYKQMSPDQRIAQLFWLAIEVIDHPERFNESLQLVSRFQPGGILYMKNSLPSVVGFSNQARSKCRVPLLIAIDAEWGLGMRINGVVSFPKAMTLGAIQDERLIYEMGLNVAAQLRRTGIHVNLAPVADVNVNPLNPVIGNRSFGENPSEVARLSVAYMHGLQDGGVMAVAKHFPGHGDTDSDSHHVLPLVPHTIERLDSVELLPFKALIKNGVMGVMTAHLEIPAMDSVRGKPVSLSANAVNGILRRELGFSGLIITDAMNMQGVRKYGASGRIEVLALMAGNDIVESTENLGRSIEEVKKAIDSNELTWRDIELKCRKVLAVKRFLELEKETDVDNTNMLNDLNAISDTPFISRLYEKAVTKICFSEDQSPTKETLPVDGILTVGGVGMVNCMSGCLDVSAWKLLGVNSIVNRGILEQAKKRNHLAVLVSGSLLSRQIWNDKVFQQFLLNLPGTSKITVVFCGSPYQLKTYDNLEKVSCVVISYEDNQFACNAVCQVLQGGKAYGKLPVTVNDIFRQGAGME